MRLRPVPHPERRATPGWIVVSLTITVIVLGATAGQVRFLHRGVDPRMGAFVGTVIALLVVWGFPSLPLRTTGRFAVLLSAGIIARDATLDPLPGDGIDLVALWLAGAIGVFVLTDRITTLALATARTADDGGGAARARRRRTAGGPGAEPGPGRTWSTIVLLAAVAVLAVVLIAPFANDRFASDSDAGTPAVGDRDRARTSLRRSDHLDMTERPELTDEILLSVRADRRAFLRGQVFDRWNGTTWVNSEPDRFRISTGTVHTDENDLGALGADTFTQRIRLEADWADLYVGAPSVVRLDTHAAATQTLDGTLAAWPEPLGRGAVYTVTSRSHPADEDGLRAADGPIPDAIRDRYVIAPTTTDRVLELADRIVDETGATTAYDRIRAFEAWMGDNLEYSLDAPPSPEGVDAVDRFLFVDRLGWCEQIATSLVVLARSQDIPARLATGFVASERDRVSGDLVVRARDAHAWAEVWFPDHGWVAFDPTADVPLAPQADENRSVLDLIREHLGLLAAIVVGVVAVGWAALRIGPHIVRRRRHRTDSPIARLDRDLGRLGERWGLERRPDESAGAFARRLADRSGHPEIRELGDLIDDHLYAPQRPPDGAVTAAGAALTRLLAEPADREPTRTGD